MKVSILKARNENVLEQFNIAKGSAIVTAHDPERDPTLAVLYYEGNLYNAGNLHTLSERAVIAAGRAAQRAPTTAFVGVAKEQLAVMFEVIGEVDTDNRYQVTIFNTDAYADIQFDYAERLSA